MRKNCLERSQAIPIKCFVSHRRPSREGGLVSRAKKTKNDHMKGLGLGASEGRAAKPVVSAPSTTSAGKKKP